MANTPISGFTSGSPAQAADEFVIARGGSNFKLTTTNVATYMWTSPTFTGPVTVNGGTITADSSIQSTTGNIVGNGFVIYRSGAAYAAILDNGDGVMRFYNGVGTNFTGIQFGGTTTSFPGFYTVNTDTSSPGMKLVTATGSGGIFLEGYEQTAPPAAPANGYRIYAQDNGAGKTQLMVIFASGAAQQLAIEP